MINFTEAKTSLDLSYKKLVIFNNLPNVDILECSDNNLKTLKNAPSSLIMLDCNRNKLPTLTGCPDSVERLYCEKNQLGTLEGCPKNAKIILCSNNILSSLFGISQNVKFLDCTNNNLKNLNFIPSNIEYLYCCNNDPYLDLFLLPETIIHISHNSNHPDYKDKNTEQIHLINNNKKRAGYNLNFNYLYK